MEHGQEKVRSKRAGKGASRTAPVRNCRRFLRGGRPRPGRCAQPGSYPCLCGTRAAAYPWPLTTRAPGVRGDSTVTLSAPAQRPRGGLGRAARGHHVVHQRHVPAAHALPRNTPARAARRSQPACRGVSRRRSSAPCRRGRSSASARLRAISMAGFMPRRRSEARLAGTAASTASAGRPPRDGRPKQAREHQRQRQAQPGLQLTDQGHARRLIVECHDGAQVGGRPAQAARAQRAGWRRRCAQRGQRAPGSRQLRVTSASQPAHSRAPRTARRTADNRSPWPMPAATTVVGRRVVEIGAGGPDAQ